MYRDWMLGMLLLIGYSIGLQSELCAQANTVEQVVKASSLPWIQVAADQPHFTRNDPGEKFVLKGFNYDHDAEGRLIEDYWVEQWPTVVADFSEMKQLGANVVRVHLQVGKFMESTTATNEANLRQLQQLVKLCEDLGIYLDLTGLGCYHKADIPAWYAELGEAERWEVQARFWQAIAKAVVDSPAVFCFDLMNEPILPGTTVETDWLAGELGGKFFVQRLALQQNGRTREEIAKAWVHKMCAAIREIDQRHLITVGVIPWAQVFQGAKPIFYAPQVGKPLDFVSVHFYPKKDQIAETIAALKVYELGKPLVVEELFPLNCSLEEAEEFVRQSQSFVDGYLSFYWGKSIAEYESSPELSAKIIAAWLRKFQSLP
jgi:hypothetical protein